MKMATTTKGPNNNNNGNGTGMVASPGKLPLQQVPLNLEEEEDENEKAPQLKPECSVSPSVLKEEERHLNKEEEEKKQIVPKKEAPTLGFSIAVSHEIFPSFIPGYKISVFLRILIHSNY
jgi:hypothetical protein